MAELFLKKDEFLISIFTGFSAAIVRPDETLAVVLNAVFPVNSHESIVITSVYLLNKL